MNMRQVGSEGEKIALKYLQKQGYRLLEKNYYANHGEIDLIMKKAGTVVFCEVKARSHTGFGTPAEAVTPRKIMLIQRTALQYIKDHGLEDAPIRFDVIEVFLQEGPRVNHIAGAF